MAFDTSRGRLRCGGCGTLGEPQAIDAQAAAQARHEHDLLAALQAGGDAATQLEARLVDCPACGAQTRLASHVVADRCAFCATPLVLAQAHTERLVRPQAMVPFGVDRALAQQRFAQWLSGLWFAPGALKRTVRQADGVRGVYLPYWTCDARTLTRYAGERGWDRTVSERTSQGTRTRTVTDWSPASGSVELRFDDILVVGSPSIPAALASRLEGWELGRLVPYHEELCAGFTIEAYRKGLREAFDEARGRMEPAIDSAIRRDIGGNHQRIHRKHTTLDDVRFKHILLPVWIGSYRFRERAFQVVVNAQTGRIAGDRPWSWWKIGLTAAAVVLVVAWLWGLSALGP